MHFADRPRALRLGLLLLIGAIALSGALGLSMGAVDIPPSRVLAILLNLDAGPSPEHSVIWDLRLPRVVLAALVGAALAAAGAAMQGLLRNPLADPGLVGVASGAALAAVATIVLGQTLALPIAWLPFVTPVASFVGGVLAAGIATRLASVDGHTGTVTMLLAGLAINSVAGAGIGLLTQLAGDAALREVTFWLFGSLSKSGWAELVVAGPILVAVLVLIQRQARPLDALLLGEAEAQHLGINVQALKRRVMGMVVIAVAVSVSLAGVIGFVGLIVPHLLRLVLGPGHRSLLPAAALGGAALLSFADLSARSWLAPAELPVGILTALIGGPFFLGLLMRLRGRVDAW